MAETLIAFRQIKIPGLLSDDLTAAQISAANTANNADEFNQCVLSQIRRLIWGDNFTKNWNDDFISAGISTLESLSNGSTFRAGICLSSDAVGNFVYVSGAAVGSSLTVTSCDVSVFNKMPAIGLIVDKPTPTTCLIQTKGDTALAGLSPGRRYFVGNSSTASLLPPTPVSGGVAYVQVIGVATDSGQLSVNPSLDMLKLLGAVVLSPLYPFAMPVGPVVGGGSGPHV